MNLKFNVKLISLSSKNLYDEIEKGNFQFILLNPNDPNYDAPDEDLDTNVTHDL